MGQVGSLPDGSELKEPEEKVSPSTLVNANFGLVFVKPHAHKPDCIEFVKDELSKKVNILGGCSIGADAIKEGNIVDKHYAAIADASENGVEGLKPTAEAKEKFQEAFGCNYDDMVAAECIKSASACALQLGKGGDPMPPKDLNNLWTTCGATVKIASGVYVARLKGGDDEEEEEEDSEEEDGGGGGSSSLFCVNGFYPSLKAAYEKDGAEVHLLVVAWDPARLSWAAFKNDVIGATNPEQANDGSIRKKLLEQWDPLGLPEQPNGTDNGVHASAGPLEALKERLLWCGFDLEKDPTGSRLVQLAVWDESRHPAINELLENPDVDVAGFKGKAFDLLENKDTPDLYVLANNVAFKEELAGVC